MASWKVQEVFSIQTWKGCGASPKIKMGVSAARLKRSFFRCVRTPDVLATLSNLISADTTRSRFRKSGSAYFLKFLISIPAFRRRNVCCKVRGNESPMPSSSKFSFRHYQVFEKKCPLYCERSVSICQTARDLSARKSAWMSRSWAWFNRLPPWDTKLRKVGPFAASFSHYHIEHDGYGCCQWRIRCCMEPFLNSPLTKKTVDPSVPWRIYPNGSGSITAFKLAGNQ